MPAIAPTRARRSTNASAIAAAMPGSLIRARERDDGRADVEKPPAHEHESRQDEDQRDRIVVPFGGAPDRDRIKPIVAAARSRAVRSPQYAAYASTTQSKQRDARRHAKCLELREKPQRREERHDGCVLRPETPDRRRRSETRSPTATARHAPPRRMRIRALTRKDRVRCEPSRRTRRTRRRRSRRAPARTTRWQVPPTLAASTIGSGKGSARCSARL